MRKDFYIFRHGETDCNAAGRWQGRSINYPLNENGISQAKLLIEKLQPLGIEIIYSSPLRRALQTAQIAGNGIGVGVKILDTLTECALGEVEGMLKNDISAKYPDLWEVWYQETTLTDTRWPKGESKKEIQQRMLKAFETMLTYPEKTIGVASHSGSMRYFLLAFGYGPHRIPNTALFHIVYENGSWCLEE